MSSSCADPDDRRNAVTPNDKHTPAKVALASIVKRVAISLLLLLPFRAVLKAQDRAIQFTVRATDSLFSIPDNFIDPATLRVSIDSSLSLKSESDYFLLAERRAIRLSPTLRALLFPPGTQASHTIRITYFALPIQLRTSYSRHQIVRVGDSTHGIDSARPGRLVATSPDESRSDLFSNFQKSGSISRGFQVGSSRDLALTSGFNLQFSGDISNDVNVTGALTEENTPIQPEGTTQTLHDVDRIFIKVRAGEHFGATLGDFFLDLNTPSDPARQFQSYSPTGLSIGREQSFRAFTQSTFDVVSRKLLGAEARLTAEYGSLEVAGASTRGKFNTALFTGQEGFQGPYRLTGKNGERAIIIIAGTERVYVNGVLMTRGERNDYTIDYAQGEIRFQSQRLITSDSRITVDFQYSDQQYNRTLLASNARLRPFGQAFEFSATYLREGDNQDAPLDVSLSDSDRTTLARAGSHPEQAYRSGVSVIGADEHGRARGSYVAIDSLLGGMPVRFYTYLPQDTINAIYNVQFGYAGAGRGAYVRQSIGQFQYVGAGHGDYDTLVYLPLPQLDQVLAFSGNLAVTQSLRLTGEFATSAFDPNRFAATSSITDRAYRFGAMYADTLPFGYVEVNAQEKHIGKQYTPLDRLEDVEFQRQYGNDLSSTTQPSSEEHREARLVYRPLPALTVESVYGDLVRHDIGFSSTRSYSRLQLEQDTLFTPRASLSYERTPTRDTLRHEDAVWQRAFGELSKAIAVKSSMLTIGTRYGREEKLTRSTSVDSLTANSFRYSTLNPFAQLRFGPAVSVSAEYERRGDDSVRSTALTRISDANTYRFILGLQNLGGFSSSLDLTYRDKRYADSSARVLNGGNSSTLLLRLEPRYQWQGRGLQIDALYEISNQRAARLERIFLPVQRGLGNYRYLGDLNHNGRADADEFAPARYSDEGQYVLLSLPTEQLFPTTNLRSSARMHLSLQEMLGMTDSASWLARALGSLATESYVRVEETSRDDNPSAIYFIRLSHFQHDSTTVRGLIELEQDVDILPNELAQSYRIHLTERRTAAEYTTGLERTYNAERSLRGRFRPSFELTNETVASWTLDRSSGDTLSVNRPHSTSAIGATTDWSYHPFGSALDYGLRLEASRAIESSRSPAITAMTNAITARVAYALETRARLRAELERDELTLDATPTDLLSLPYALTGGRTTGITWLWRLSLDYQFAGGILATVGYDARNIAIPGGTRETIHNARAEVRATF